MNLHKLIFTENACYKAGRTITVKGIMVHSTGANNPNLKRYVGPDDGLLGVNQYGNYWNTYHPDGREVCVHAFIGKLADGSIATYQTLPWNHRGWHAGGSANNTHIGFEICEDGLTDYTFFQKVYREAVELCVYLCKEYGLTEKNIICHSEGYKQGVASNHGDVMHWFPKHGKSMDTFRADVKALLTTGIEVGTTPKCSDEESIWNYLYGKLGNAYGTAGMMGNLYAESALKPTNLQNSFETKLGYSDAEYTEAVDNGSYDNFVKDSAGYGLAQWTYWSRKQALLEFAQAKDKSIGDLSMQLDFIWKELSESYTGLLATLKSATSVTEASTAVLTIYERPADQGESVQAKRASFGQTYFDKYAVVEYPEKLTTGYYRVRKTWADSKSQLGAYRILANAKAKADANSGYSVFSDDGKVVYASSATEEKMETAFEPYMVKVSISDLNIRKGPGTNYGKSGYTGKGCFTIVEEADGQGATKWGLLKSYQTNRNGWISLDYAKKI